MEMTIKSPVLGLNPKIINHKQAVDIFIPRFSSKRVCFSLQTKYNSRKFCERESRKCFSAVCGVLSGAEDVGVSSSQFEGFSVSIADTNKARERKISVEVSGAKSLAMFDNVFDKLVAEAQPIPGFRRVKGGKTPNIPRDILLEVLGPSKVYKQAIKKVIDSTVAEFVEKEGLKVNKGLRVEQSFEDLEASFEPGEKFSFDAVIQLQEEN